jgi:neuroligin
MRFTQCFYSTRNSANARQATLLLVTAVALLARATLAGPRYSSRIVETKTGAIRGIILELNSRHLEPVEVFKGVPYAAPPVGELRYRPPAPPLVWSGTRLADTFGAVCPQRYPDISNRSAALLSMPRGRYHHLKRLVPLLTTQSEDCLFLNLYVPGSGKSRWFQLHPLWCLHCRSWTERNAGSSNRGELLLCYIESVFKWP